MAQLQDQPQDSQPAMKTLADLEDELDRLWAKYLVSLDHYQAAMTILSKHFSNGFFSLARANMRSPGQRRYGQDFYDERMKASTHFCVTKGPDDRLMVEAQDKIALESFHFDEKDGQDEPKQQPSPPATPSPDEDADEEPNNADDSSSTKASSDPLRWFGILLPQEIRKTQSAFVEVIGDPMVDAVNSSRVMRQLETDIRKLRKSVKKATAVAA